MLVFSLFEDFMSLSSQEIQVFFASFLGFLNFFYTSFFSGSERILVLFVPFLSALKACMMEEPSFILVFILLLLKFLSLFSCLRDSLNFLNMKSMSSSLIRLQASSSDSMFQKFVTFKVRIFFFFFFFFGVEIDQANNRGLKPSLDRPRPGQAFFLYRTSSGYLKSYLVKWLGHRLQKKSFKHIRSAYLNKYA